MKGVYKGIRNSPYTIWALSSLFICVDTFVYSLVIATFPYILQHILHVPESYNGIVSAMFNIGGILGSLSSGYLSDKWGKRRIFQMLVALLYIVAGLIFYFTAHFYQLLLFRLINGIASGMAWTILYTTVGDVFPANLLGFKVAVMYLTNSLSYTVSPICGQRLFELTGSVQPTALLIVSLGILELVLLATLFGNSLKIREKIGVSGSTPPTLQIAVENKNIRLQPQPSIPIWRLILRVPVILSTLSILAYTALINVLELTIPLRLNDHFDMPNNIGITFFAYGLTNSILAPGLGWCFDWLIGRYGEYMRYYLMGMGTLSTNIFMVWIGLSGTYPALLAGYIMYAIPCQFMFIPAQSAYGDLTNYSGVNSMAKSYAIATSAWNIGSLIFSPVGTALYAHAGFFKPLIGLSATVDGLCAITFFVYGVRLQRNIATANI